MLWIVFGRESCSLQPRKSNENCTRMRGIASVHCTRLVDGWMQFEMDRYLLIILIDAKIYAEFTLDHTRRTPVTSEIVSS
jgi:hypothetical protein